MLRTGPYGDGFADPGSPAATPGAGLTLAKLESAPHGVDLGPLQPRLPDALRTASGKIELAPDQLVADVDRLRTSLEAPRNGGLVMVGRRHLRSNNSWMHNLPLLVSGPARCTLHVNPADAARHELVDGAPAEVRSRTGRVVADVEITDAVMPGVVSLPHGWGHGLQGTVQRVAAEHAGTNSNLLADELLVDAVSGNAVLNGIPVELAPVRERAAATAVA
jgi:anaerobic selenocysteine-containing dehydrogenase